jgi:hypothetical protein
VDVHAHQHLAAHLLEDLVHARRLVAAGIGEHAQPRVLAGQALEDREGAVAAATVGDDDLEAIGRVVLRQGPAYAGLDEPLLVEARHADGDERELGRSHGDLMSHGLSGCGRRPTGLSARPYNDAATGIAKYLILLDLPGGTAAV